MVAPYLAVVGDVGAGWKTLLKNATQWNNTCSKRTKSVSGGVADNNPPRAVGRSGRAFEFFNKALESALRLQVHDFAHLCAGTRGYNAFSGFELGFSTLTTIYWGPTVYFRMA